ncbi:MAG TPA: hypothetical protein VFX59_25085 [Polyangiales bacterium]|nr:hypothetical protein [Polyangiales bacterium]
MTNLVATVVRVVILVVAVSFALESLKLEKTVTSLIAGIGVVGLALGFAFQDIARSFRTRSELEAVRGAMIASLESLPGRIVEAPIEVLYAEFGANTVKAQVLIWLNAGDEEHYRRSRSAARIAVKRVLDQRGVVLPAPQRTVELGPDFKRHALRSATTGPDA